MSLRNWRFRIKHILESIERINLFISDMSYDSFCQDEKTQFAVICCFSVIGEAARLVPHDIQEQNPDIPWKQMIRMRNVLVHEYDRVEPEIIWNTIQQDLQSLSSDLNRILEA